MIISPLSFCIVAFCLLSNVVATKPERIREVELGAKYSHLKTKDARRKAAAHSATARKLAIGLHDDVNDNHCDGDTLKKMLQIADHHDANEKVQNNKAHQNSKQAATHHNNAHKDYFGDKTQRKEAKKDAERSIQDAQRGKKEARDSHTHTEATIEFLQLGQKHLDNMRMVGHKDPNFHNHHQELRNCVSNAAEPKPSQWRLNRARKRLHGLTNVGILGHGDSWNSPTSFGIS